MAIPEEPVPRKVGPFSINGRLGTGGMGVVLDANLPNGERVALKLIRPTGDPEHCNMLTSRLLREAKILEHMRHPGIVGLKDSGFIDDIVYLAMDCVEGVTLHDVRRQGPITDVAVLVSLAKQLAETLQALHDNGIIHRDIKPGNVMIDRSGRAIVTDFGIAHDHEGTAITKTGQLLGSPGFVPPEILEGEEPTPLSDQYSFGRLLFEIAATKPPSKLPPGTPLLAQFALRLDVDWGRFPAEPPWPGIAGLIRRMIAHDPNARFPSCRALIEAINGFEAMLTDPDSAPHPLDPLATHDHSDLLDAQFAEATVFAPANTLHRFLAALQLEAHSPWSQASNETSDEMPSPEIRKMRPVSNVESAASAPVPTVPARTPSMRPTQAAPRAPSRAPSRVPSRVVETRTSPLLRPLLAAVFIALGVGVEALHHASGSEAYRYRGALAMQKHASIAQSIVLAAKAELAADNLAAAKQLYGECVEATDHPDCHRGLAAILLLAGDRAAEAHARKAAR